MNSMTSFSQALKIRSKLPDVAAVVEIDGHEYCVAGDYSPEDKSTGSCASFSVERVWLDSDLDATNLMPIIGQVTLDYFEAQALKNCLNS